MKLIKCVKIAIFFFPCYVRTVCNIEDFKLVLHLIQGGKQLENAGRRQLE